MEKITLKLFFVATFLFVIGCAKPVENTSDIPVFSYPTPIVNPPDEFFILFNNVTVGEMFTDITFADSTVWRIAKTGDGRYNLKFNNLESSIQISVSDTLALLGAKKYRVIVSNAYYTEVNNFYVSFSRLNYSYNEFEPKF